MSKPKITCQQATPDMVEHIIEQLRPADLREILRMGDGPPEDVLTRSILHSDQAGVMLINGHIAAVFGLAVRLDGSGIPWMVGTKTLANYPTVLLRESRAWLAEWQALCPLLTNYVDAAYGQALKWLAWLGFEIGAPEPIGLHGALFCPITFIKKDA